MDNTQGYMLEHLQQIAAGQANRIKIIDTVVDADVQIEFFELINKVREVPNDLDELDKELYLPTTDVARKKNILAIMSVFGEVKSFRLLEKYLENAEPELKPMAFVAYQQSKMLLESKLMDEDFVVFVASGLGGKDGRLRFVFVLVSKNEDFDDVQKKIIDGELDYILKNNNAILEKTEYVNKYVIITVLTPIFANLVEMVENIIIEVNQYGNFLREDIFITNEKVLNESNIDNFVNTKISSERENIS